MISSSRSGSGLHRLTNILRSWRDCVGFIALLILRLAVRAMPHFLSCKTITRTRCFEFTKLVKQVTFFWIRWTSDSSFVHCNSSSTFFRRYIYVRLMIYVKIHHLPASKGLYTVEITPTPTNAFVGLSIRTATSHVPNLSSWTVFTRPRPLSWLPFFKWGCSLITPCYSKFYLPSVLRTIKACGPPCNVPSTVLTLRVSTASITIRLED
jgi:hypothetical protein